MKNFIKTLVILFVCTSAFAQTNNFYQPNTKPANASIQANRVDYSHIVDLKNQLRQGRNSRSVQNVLLDYDAVDQLACTDSGGVYDAFIWELNTRFSDDSSNNLNYTWTAVSFDTLIDASTLPNSIGASYPYGVSTVTIDSIVVFASHENFTGTQDSIVISIRDFVTGGPSGTILNGVRTDAQQVNVTNPILHSDTIFTSTSLAPPSQGQIGLIVRPNFTLNVGQKFVVTVHFYGDTANALYFVGGYCDLCGGGCIAEASIFEDNSVSRWIRFQNGSDFTGRDNDIYFPCGRTGPPQSAVPGNCESWFVQNTNILAFISVEVPFTATISQNVNNVCPGESVPLSVSFVGESDPNNVTVSWSPIGGLSNPFGTSTDATVDSTTTFTATIIDAAGPDTLVKTVTITTRGVSISAGADVAVACGGTANLLATFTFHPGAQAGATFQWKNETLGTNGPLTLNYNNVGPGLYSVTVKNNFNCTATDEVLVSIANTGQSVSFTVSPLNPDGKICIGTPITFSNTSSILTGWNWRWTFKDDPTFFTSQNVTRTFTTAYVGDTVTLRADSASGACVLTSVRVYDVTNVNCPIGINGASNLQNFVRIYPNPTDGLLNIEFKNLNGENGLLSVYDVHGKRVFDEALDVTGDIHKKIDLGKFAEGIYLVRIQLGNESLTTKFQVNR